MEVKLFEHEGLDVRTGERVIVGDRFGPQYRIYIDGIGVGYISSRPDAVVRLSENRFSSRELEEIRCKVEELIGRKVPAAKQPPKVDPDLLKARNDGIESDDFD